jgi:transposase
MRKVREVLRLKILGFSGRQIARTLKLAVATVSDYLRRAEVAGLSWPLPENLDDTALEKALFVQREDQRPSRPLPDWNVVHLELRRKHVTLALLWEEYKREHPDGYQYSQYCDLYRRWAGTLEIWMRQEHRAGEKLFSDYSGDGIPWVDPKTGEVHEAPLFVAVLGASSYTYAEVTPSQELKHWIGCHVRALEFFGGAPKLIVPDQTKTAVKSSSRYEPELNASFEEFARHYSTCILPARPRKPRDKAKVEVGVLIAQRWIIAALRNRTFYSPDEINEAIWDELLERLNHRPMRKLKRSRADLFHELDRLALRPLPERRHEFAQWKIAAGVNLDYHVEFERNYYSVPFQYARQNVDLRATARTVEIFLGSKRIASHLRASGQLTYSTQSEHMPRAHQQYLEWTPSRILHWAQTIGRATAELVEKILAERPHPEQGYRSCLGILRLSKRYGQARLEKACARAGACRSYSYRAVESILKKNLEAQPLPQAPQGSLPLHENLRGSSYFS